MMSIKFRSNITNSCHCVQTLTNENKSVKNLKMKYSLSDIQSEILLKPLSKTHLLQQKNL